MRIFLMCVFVLTAGYGQFYISGDIAPSVMIRQSDQELFDLPYRLISADLGYSLGDLDIRTALALEHRINSGEYRGDVREFYGIWYNRLGELKLGKQIHAWGAADGNNPTDNLNPYDFYFMFLPGTDRKIGTVSVALTMYIGALTMEAVFIPEHLGNRVPYNEPDFPIIPLPEPKDNQLIENSRDYDVGVRLKTMVGENDISLSYINGHDNSLSLTNMQNTFGIFIPEFGYRKTNMFGADVVGFLGDVTYRLESAYFRTEDDDWLLKTEATYSQHVVQLEYTELWDIQFSGQFIGSEIHEVSGSTDVLYLQSSIPDKETFQPGMGTPFAIFTDRGMSASAKGTLLDNSLEIMGNVFYDLNERGKMLGIMIDYSPWSGWEISGGMTSFIGNGDDPEYPFNTLEDFSHVRCGITYSF